MVQKITVGLCGSEGYVGQALAALVLQHPNLTLSGLVSKEGAVMSSTPFDVLFLATPCEASMELVPQFAHPKTTLIDLSGAFRLAEEDFVQWYGMPHTAAHWLPNCVYGLSPWWIAKDRAENSVLANPGCYATCALMSLIPLLRDHIVQPGSIIIDAKSGVSGAGKKATQALLFSEMSNNFFPYKVGKHQHTPEINAGLAKFTGKTCEVVLTTQMLPLVRGVAMTIYANAETNFGTDQAIVHAIAASYQDAYKDYPLVKIQDIDGLAIKDVCGTPNTHIGYWVHQGKITLFACLDNLLKGAASQAIENLNLLFDFPITTGLTHLGGW